jgi:hypothetical protein
MFLVIPGFGVHGYIHHWPLPEIFVLGLLLHKSIFRI